MMGIAASEAGRHRAIRSLQEAASCKPRANCLKPKEFRKIWCLFDLRRAANYLKVKTIARRDRKGLSKAHGFGQYNGKHDP
jgi:hypothetical protein